jgi:hypothetical protein
MKRSLLKSKLGCQMVKGRNKAATGLHSEWMETSGRRILVEDPLRVHGLSRRRPTLGFAFSGG